MKSKLLLLKIILLAVTVNTAPNSTPNIAPIEQNATNASSSTAEPMDKNTTETSSSNALSIDKNSTVASSSAAEPMDKNTTETSSSNALSIDKNSTVASSSTAEPMDKNTTETSSYNSLSIDKNSTVASSSTAEPVDKNTTISSSSTAEPIDKNTPASSTIATNVSKVEVPCSTVTNEEKKKGNDISNHSPSHNKLIRYFRKKNEKPSNINRKEKNNTNVMTKMYTPQNPITETPDLSVKETNTESNGLVTKSALVSNRSRVSGVRPVPLPIIARSKAELKSENKNPDNLQPAANLGSKTYYLPHQAIKFKPAMGPILQTTSKPVSSVIRETPTPDSKIETIIIPQPAPQIYPISYPEPRSLTQPSESKPKVKQNDTQELHLDGLQILRPLRQPTYSAPIVKLVPSAPKSVHEFVTTPELEDKPSSPKPIIRPIESPKLKFELPVAKTVSRSQLIPKPSNHGSPKVEKTISTSLKKSKGEGNETLLCTEDGYHSISNEYQSYIECKDSHALKILCPQGEIFDEFAKYPDYACKSSPDKSELQEWARIIKEEWPQLYNVIRQERL